MSQKNQELVKLNLVHKILVYSVVAIMFLSGAVWAVSHYWFGGDDTLNFGQLSFEHWTMTIHGLAATIFLVVLGTLFPVHIKRSWAARKNIGPGIFLLGLIFVLIATGCGLYYFGNENLRAGASWVHLVGGLCLPFIMASHIALGKRAP